MMPIYSSEFSIEGSDHPKPNQLWKMKVLRLGEKKLWNRPRKPRDAKEIIRSRDLVSLNRGVRRGLLKKVAMTVWLRGMTFSSLLRIRRNIRLPRSRPCFFAQYQCCGTGCPLSSFHPALRNLDSKGRTLSNVGEFTSVCSSRHLGKLDPELSNLKNRVKKFLHIQRFLHIAVGVILIS